MGELSKFHFLDDQLLIAIDGTGHFSSNKIRCPNCSQMKHKTGKITYFHNTLLPVIVSPGNGQVFNLPPEFIIPQENYSKQDSELAAMKRWLNRYSEKLSNHKVTFLGDDLYSNQPMVEILENRQFNYIFTCFKEGSHTYLYEILAFLEGRNALKQVKDVKYEGLRKPSKVIYQYRFVNDVPLRKVNFLSTNWAELTILNEQGEIKFKTACVTNHKITEENITDIIRAHRSRWKIENENNNQLKTKGYHLEHNFGHGKKYLTSLLLTMNLLAFLFHTVLHLIDKAYRVLREKLRRRQTFFDDLKALVRYFYFESWDHLLSFMIEQLEIKLEPD